MKHWMSLAFILAFSVSPAWTAPSAVVEEALYQEFKTSIQSGHEDKSFQVTKLQQTLYVDALWDLLQDGSPQALDSLKNINPLHYDLVERLRIAILRLKYGLTDSLPHSLLNEVVALLRKPKSDIKIIYTLAAYEEEILKAGHGELIKLAKSHEEYSHISQDEERKTEFSDDMLADLFYHSPDVSTYMNGEYIKSVKVYMFCRTNRLYPCLMVMRNVHGDPVRDLDGKLWAHSSLAASKQGLPTYTRNGNTPAGIFTMDSVMPSIDQVMSYGRNRRIILNFVPKSKNESLFRSLLPDSSQDKDWWQESVVARDMGRNLFRIHGTGKINPDPNTPYYPFMRTSGCIAQRENTYDGITYRDQRILLDTIMKAMNLPVTFENEVKVKGILYVTEIDDRNEPVTLEDLRIRGIE